MSSSLAKVNGYVWMTEEMKSLGFNSGNSKPNSASDL